MAVVRAEGGKCRFYPPYYSIIPYNSMGAYTHTILWVGNGHMVIGTIPKQGVPPWG
jgi:hypothetical protein